jgi:hypothetical protein
MKRFALLIAMISINAIAANKYYDIGMDITVGGEKIPAPRILAKQNVTETVIMKDKFFEVTATENPLDQSVKMDFVLGEITEDGKRIVLERPTIITHENKRAEMVISNDEGREDLKLSVVPVVKNL